MLPLSLGLISVLVFSSFQAGAGVYRWTDDDGGVHYGDDPSQPHAKKLPIPGHHFVIEKNRKAFQVTRVFDGDTLELQDGTRVRLLGVNTPEVARYGKPGQAGGEAASQALRALIAASDYRIHLSFDRERKDRYGRLLAYTYDGTGRFINAILLRQGHAHTAFKIPRMKEEEALLQAEREARNARRGIWRLPQYQVTTPQRLRDSLHRYRLVRGRAHTDKTTRGVRYLTMPGGFYVRIEKSVELPLKDYTGREVLVRGWVRSRRGQRWIRVEHASQIETIR